MRLLFLVASVSCAGSIACTSSNNNFCSANEDCADTGFCNLETSECSAAPACDCQDPLAPVCDLGSCRGCEIDSECASLDSASPICGDQGQCVACAQNTDCPEEAPTCSSDNRCIECEDESACGGAQPFCSPENLCVECLGNDECGSEVCSEDFVCVECTENSHCLVSTAPTCCSDNTCGPCKSDDDCDSELCTESSGTCVADSEIFYVDPAGTDGATCGARVAPCRTLLNVSTRIAAPRDHVVLRQGNYEGTVTITQSVEIVGHGEVVLSTSAPTAHTLRFEGAAKVFTLENLVVVGGSTDNTLECDGSTNSLLATGIRVDAAGSLASGIESRCDSTIRESVVENAGTGISTIGGALVLERSLIRNNERGGLVISSSNCSIINNIISKNGSTNPPSETGGIALFNESQTCEIAFNTIVGNVNGLDEVTADGLSCPNPGGTKDIHHNIFSHADDDTAFEAGCTFTFNLFTLSGIAGTGNIDGNPLFVDADNGDYHLQATSPAINTGGSGASVQLDLDGNPRPTGAAFDLGAYEFQP